MRRKIRPAGTFASEAESTNATHSPDSLSGAQLGALPNAQRNRWGEPLVFSNSVPASINPSRDAVVANSANFRAG
ncbi:protein of unknown function (plasmid) [Cupriavidus taiwanensis]|uniref:Uncharacterized protein n=1 Tax=Cupriavidus taiwanensis TaxID=164546 RepID=A0A375HFP9_9BURK|nr:protein of unknown function [Cupriavidus taiwanensis]SOZ72396.1 protein of unknown function [Cupriavidus taiwanensis]SOZ74746.1 protein of unknown function [Cupriavidus taiwanensis]SPA03599.1 protein of unknown function [Cupriavidus taiwanensis]SPA11499.1 protein of unknown function [Cupriavidus taiwanensis]